MSTGLGIVRLYCHTHTVVECLELSAPINGTVRLPTLTAFGFVANYSCINRKTLIGQDQRECMANGQWSGTEPTCQRMLLWLYCFPVNAKNVYICLQVLYLLYCIVQTRYPLFYLELSTLSKFEVVISLLFTCLVYNFIENSRAYYMYKTSNINS